MQSKITVTQAVLSAQQDFTCSSLGTHLNSERQSDKVHIVEVVDRNKPKAFEHFFRSVQVMWIIRHFPAGPAVFAQSGQMTGTV